MLNNPFVECFYLVLRWNFMPLFDEEMTNDFWKARQNFCKTWLISVLFYNVQEPVVKMFFVWFFEHFRNESILSWISIEHVYWYTGVKGCHLNRKCFKIWQMFYIQLTWCQKKAGIKSISPGCKIQWWQTALLKFGNVSRSGLSQLTLLWTVFPWEPRGLG